MVLVDGIPARGLEVKWRVVRWRCVAGEKVRAKWGDRTRIRESSERAHHFCILIFSGRVPAKETGRRFDSLATATAREVTESG